MYLLSYSRDAGLTAKWMRWVFDLYEKDLFSDRRVFISEVHVSVKQSNALIGTFHEYQAKLELFFGYVSGYLDSLVRSHEGGLDELFMEWFGQVQLEDWLRYRKAQVDDPIRKWFDQVHTETGVELRFEEYLTLEYLMVQKKITAITERGAI